MGKFKTFFVKNLWCFIFIIIGVVLVALGMISVYFMLVALALFGAVFIRFGVLLRRKYLEQKNYSYDEDYFDARKIDYDEEVYYIGSPEKRKKEIGKNFFAKLSSQAPSVGLFMLGFACYFLIITTIIGLLFW